MKRPSLTLTLSLTAVLLVAATPAGAHCDAVDGPVVKAARLALEKADATPALWWVDASREREVRAAFDQTQAVRGLGPKARDLADTWFFETLVRIHREGEGAAYSGLKPAGTTVPEGIAEADHAIDAASDDHLVEALGEHMVHGLRQRFRHVMEARKQAGTSLAAGREFVRAYTDFVHYVDGLHTAVAGGGPHVEK